MASSSCECKNGNKLSDLEKAELSLQLAGLVMKKILPIEEFQAIAKMKIGDTYTMQKLVK